ncbi:1888_t:CDS:2 [Ambispora leptoticha]|uniref:1888_t:CDS:1 n=1 Tax=Ambispora leptoticha TaxID=144679 RepID=A0A9N8ZPJ5_9GLOM|nr:1888_t:CDS:2 [Ambispora leptoticha]
MLSSRSFETFFLNITIESEIGNELSAKESSCMLKEWPLIISGPIVSQVRNERDVLKPRLLFGLNAVSLRTDFCPVARKNNAV